MKAELVFTWLPSTAPETLSRADSVLSLANAHPETSDTLAACATVIMAAALEQGTISALSMAAHGNAIGHGVDVSATPCGEALQWTVRQRMLLLPELATDGMLCLDRHSPYTRDLHDLIDLRNRLVHIREEAQSWPVGSPNVTVEGNQVHIRVDDIPENPWTSVTLEKATEFRQALGVYFEEVLHPPSGEIEPGLMVRLCGKRR